MKLKLATLHTDSLKSTLALFSPVRKFVVLKFSPNELIMALSASTDSLRTEPQIWCRLLMHAIFDQVEIQSLRENTILLEINADLLLQTLRNFDKANLEGLNIRLQRKDSSSNHGQSNTTTGGGGRTASLALFYSNVNANTNTINHTFRIPVRILKSLPDLSLLKEPVLGHVELLARLPNTFLAVFKRLDKFKKALATENLLMRVSLRDGGHLGFVIGDEGKYQVTITWKDLILVFQPGASSVGNGDALRNEALLNLSRPSGGDTHSHEIMVRLRDWQSAHRIVQTCHTVILAMTEKDCVLQCLLEDTQDIVVVYCISGIRMRSPLDY